MIDLLIKELNMTTHRFSEPSSSRISLCIDGRTQAQEALWSYEDSIYLRLVDQVCGKADRQDKADALSSWAQSLPSNIT